MAYEQIVTLRRAVENWNWPLLVHLPTDMRFPLAHTVINVALRDEWDDISVASGHWPFSLSAPSLSARLSRLAIDWTSMDAAMRLAAASNTPLATWVRLAGDEGSGRYILLLVAAASKSRTFSKINEALDLIGSVRRTNDSVFWNTGERRVVVNKRKNSSSYCYH